MHDPSFRKIRRALVSVSDKTGIGRICTYLARTRSKFSQPEALLGLLRESGVAVIDVSDETGVPELLDGRLKRYIQKFTVEFLEFEKTRTIAGR